MGSGSGLAELVWRAPERLAGSWGARENISGNSRNRKPITKPSGDFVIGIQSRPGAKYEVRTTSKHSLENLTKTSTTYLHRFTYLHSNLYWFYNVNPSGIIKFREFCSKFFGQFFLEYLQWSDGAHIWHGAGPIHVF